MKTTFTRKLGEQIILPLTAFDRTGARQSLSGVTDLRCTIRKANGDPVVEDDAAHCAIDETGVDTAGDFTYSRPPDGGDTQAFEVGHMYQVDFRCTIGGLPTAIPEADYIELRII